jgi:dUTP pyrophosphatase
MVERITNTKLPAYASNDAAGIDLFASESGIVPAWGKSIVPTGCAIRMPVGVYGRIASRSGLSAKNDIEVGAGVIDIDYTGEIKVILRNFSDTPYEYNMEKAIAQLILTRYTTADIKEIAYMSEIKTKRGAGGFGSTD